MPDSPDYSKFLPGSVRFSLQDFGELAARLGSIQTHDRRGELIWYDNFSTGLGSWITVLSGIGSSISLAPVSSNNSGFSAKLTAGTTLNKSALMAYRLGIFSSNRFGIEFRFSLPEGFESVEFLCQVIKNNVAYQIEVKLYLSGGTLVLVDGNNVEHIIGTGISLGSAYIEFNNIKIVFDIDKLKYTRIIYTSTEYDVSSNTIKTSVSVGSNKVSSQIKIVGDGGASESSYLDYIILTGNEP